MPRRLIFEVFYIRVVPGCARQIRSEVDYVINPAAATGRRRIRRLLNHATDTLRQPSIGW